MRVKGLGQLKLVAMLGHSERYGEQIVTIGTYNQFRDCSECIMKLTAPGKDVKWVHKVLEAAKNMWNDGRYNPNAPPVILLHSNWSNCIDNLSLFFQFKGMIRNVEGCLRAAARLLEKAAKKVGLAQKA